MVSAFLLLRTTILKKNRLKYQNHFFYHNKAPKYIFLSKKSYKKYNEEIMMENTLFILEDVKNHSIATIDVIKNMRIGDYFKLGNSWIQITKIHVKLAKDII